MSIPNMISIGRIFLVPVFALLYTQDKVMAAMGVLLLAAASDVLDGAIARRFHMETELGRAAGEGLRLSYIDVCFFYIAD